MPARDPRPRAFLQPIHAILLAFPVALFSTALASDVTYLNTAEMQWSNFASWLITGALIFGAPVLAWAAIGLIRHRREAHLGLRALYLLALAVMWVAGLVNAFQHSHDAWASVGALGLILSIVSTLAALVAAWVHAIPVDREFAR